MITLSLLVRATYMYGVVLHAHPIRGESHNQRNTTGEVATVARFYWSLWTRSQTFAALVLSQSFPNGALVPLGGHGTVLWVHVQRPSRGHEQTPKLGIFIDEQGPQVLRVFWRGALLMTVWEPLLWVIRTSLASWSRNQGKSNRTISPKFLKTCSVVSLVEYIS